MLPRGSFAEMSILDYFSRKTGTLPDPNGSLSSLMPPGAIVSANREVDKLMQSSKNSQQPKRKRSAKNKQYVHGFMSHEHDNMNDFHACYNK